MIEKLDTLLDEPFKSRDHQRYLPFRYYEAPCKVPKEFKRELARIGGKLPDGRPILRCKWGMDITWIRSVRETSGEHINRRVPRYVMSRDVITREERTPAGVIAVHEHGVFFGDPHFYLEQWKPVEHFCAPGMSIDQAEAAWEKVRWQAEEEEWEAPPDAHRFQSLEQYSGAMKEYREAMQRHRPILSGDGKGNVIQKSIDHMGPFPRHGRYEYLTKLRPAGAEPNNEWLEIVRATYARRTNRHFTDEQDELDDLNLEMATARNNARADQTREMIERLGLHWHPVGERRKGGSGQSIVFLPGKQPDDKGANA